MLDPDSIARARAVDILSVATHYGARLRKAGGIEFVGPYPRCGGRDRFAVNVRKGSGYSRIPPDAWANFDARMADWRERYKHRHTEHRGAP
jgi:hypothetical protein